MIPFRNEGGDPVGFRLFVDRLERGYVRAVWRLFKAITP